MLLGLRLGSRTLEHMNREVADLALGVPRRDVPPPAGRRAAAGRHGRRQGGADAPAAPEGPRPHHRRTKGEKANKKQMACVGAVYTIDPFVRGTDDILDEVLREGRGEDRPEPNHKHVWAEMTREIVGERSRPRRPSSCPVR